MSDPYARYKVEDIECPRCDAIFGVSTATGEDQDGACPGCGAWLHLEYDAEMDERGKWRGGYRVRVAK